MNTHSPTPVPPAWVTEHEVSYVITPFREHLKDRGPQQTGYSLELFGRFDPAGVADLVGVAESIHERLKALALEALRDLPVATLVQVQPSGRATIPLEPKLFVDVQLIVIASPPEPEHALPPDEIRRVIALVERRLRELGLKRR